MSHLPWKQLPEISFLADFFPTRFVPAAEFARASQSRKASCKILPNIVIPSQRLIVCMVSSRSWSMRHLHVLSVSLVSLPGLGLSHKTDGRLPKAQAAVQSLHWQGPVPVTDATETKITRHKTWLGTGLKKESHSVIYFLALLIAKTSSSIWGEDSKQRSRTPDTNGIYHKYIHSKPISLRHPICQTDFASFFPSISSSRGQHLACSYRTVRRYINQNPTCLSTAHLRGHLEKTVKDSLKL